MSGFAIFVLVMVASVLNFWAGHFVGWVRGFDARDSVHGEAERARLKALAKLDRILGPRR